MNCPSCAKPMIEETHHGVTVDRCESCQGFWFDIEEIQRYLNARGTRPGHPIPRDPELAAAKKGPAQQCPCCEENALNVGTLRGIDFLRCSWCGGVFLSGAELNKIQRDSSELGRENYPSQPGPKWGPSSIPDIAEVALWIIAAIMHSFD